MNMSYTTNHHIPALRMKAARLVIKEGWSTRQVARYTGYNQSTVVRWVKEAKISRKNSIPTKSSRPHSHPNALSSQIVYRIPEIRSERDQCAEIIHHRITQEGVIISLSSIKRVLKRYGISRYSKWKKWHIYPPRPLPDKPGMLIQIDSMREGLPREHLYAYALIDVHSRWAWAKPIYDANSRASARFLYTAQRKAPFQFHNVQSDHGQEFSKWFTKVIEHKGVKHRHSRVRTPTDNAYVERFIQTLQRECLNRTTRDLKAWERAIPEFLEYYNTERPHMGLNMKTPEEMMQRY